jgi:hypothetical protein
MASSPAASSMPCKSCRVGCACSRLANPNDNVHAEPKKAHDSNGVSPARINDNGDTLKVMCVQGHGRSLCFEVDNFDDEIPPWVQRWMEKHAANCGGTICCPDKHGYESEDSSSAISVESVKGGTGAIHGPGLSLILLSDSDSDNNE